MERKRILNISVPQDFTTTMPPYEAGIRTTAAKKVEGVTFRLRDPNDREIRAYATKLPGKLIGTTTADSNEGLEKYAALVSKHIPFRPSTQSKKAS